jgi:general secretion pathway protein B
MQPAPAATAPVAADAPGATAGTAVPAAPAEALPGLRDLSADERAALPPLKLSMHVFADEPAGRFVLIDGRRYTEGMAIAQGLVLHEIRRDGVVLELHGRRFLLSRPG